MAAAIAVAIAAMAAVAAVAAVFVAAVTAATPVDAAAAGTLVSFHSPCSRIQVGIFGIRHRHHRRTVRRSRSRQFHSGQFRGGTRLSILKDLDRVEGWAGVATEVDRGAAGEAEEVIRVLQRGTVVATEGWAGATATRAAGREEGETAEGETEGPAHTAPDSHRCRCPEGIDWYWSQCLRRHNFCRRLRER